MSNTSVNSLPHFHPNYQNYHGGKNNYGGYNKRTINIQTNDSQSFHSQNYLQSPGGPKTNDQQFSYQLSVPQLPHIKQFFPNL